MDNILEKLYNKCYNKFSDPEYSETNNSLYYSRKSENNLNNNNSQKYNYNNNLKNITNKDIINKPAGTSENIKQNFHKKTNILNAEKNN